MSDFDEDNSRWQAIMSKAYDKWTDGLSYLEFLQTLERHELVAVVMGNLNYQVNNGGFQQWVDNGFALAAEQVLDVIRNIQAAEGTTDAERVHLVWLWDNVRNLIRFVDLKKPGKGFANYWIRPSKDRGGYFYNDEYDDDAEEEGRALAESLNDHYYDVVNELLPAIERYIVKIEPQPVA